MKRKVVWSEDALADYKQQIAYIALENQTAARKIASRIRLACAKLGLSPTGRPGHKPGTYEKVIDGTSYVIVYALPDERQVLAVLRVFHSAQDWRRD